MLCICTYACQKRVGKQIFYFSIGDTFDFDECPKNFRAAVEEPKGYDFIDMTEEEIKESKATIADLKLYMKEVHPSIKVNANIGRDKLIDKMVYARDNDENQKVKAEEDIL